LLVDQMAILDSVPTALASFVTFVATGKWGEVVALPVWVVLSGVVLIVALVLGRLLRPSYEGGGGGWRFVAIILLVIVAWRGFQFLEESKAEAARSALAERVARAITAPLEGNPLLACANGVTNAELRAACERTVFAKPENAAAAVALVKDRLDLLTVASEPTTGLGPDDPRIQRLRRALEIDDFGLVAYVLAESERCQPDACGAFALFKDVEKIKANMAARAFETLVEKQAIIWSPGRTGPFGFKQMRPESAPPPVNGSATVTSGTVEPAAPPPPPVAEAPPPPAVLAPPVSLAPSKPETHRAEPPPPKPVARPPLPKPLNAAAPVQPATPRLPPPTPLTPPPAPTPVEVPADEGPSNPDN
jgi:hypothetical protein